MKKLFRTAALVVVASSFVAASAAQAKTEGNTVGANVAYNRARLTDKYDQQIGVGVNYKHAFNYNGVYLAPGVFADYLGNSRKESAAGVSTKSNLDYRYGAKVDLGYDITNEVAAYVTGGIARDKYSNNIVGQGKENANKIAAIYGVGANYKICKNLSANIEYNFQNLKNKYPAGNDKAKVRVDSLQVGLAYHF